MENGKVSRDVTCPICKAEPRENCKNDYGEDMGRMCHYDRYLVLIQNRPLFVRRN